MKRYRSTKKSTFSHHRLHHARVHDEITVVSVIYYCNTHSRNTLRPRARVRAGATTMVRPAKRASPRVPTAHRPRGSPSRPLLVR